MTSTPTLALGPIDNISNLKTCSPYLMPFHINYSGPAPISTYLRVNAAKETVGAPTPEPTTATSDPHSSPNIQQEGSSNDSNTPSDPPKADMEIDAPSAEPVASASSSLAKRVTDATTRFISSFRGRTIQGLKVPLPEGYSGVVLRSKDASTRGENGKGAEKKGVNGRANQAGKRRTRSVKSDADDNAEADRDVELVQHEFMDVDDDEEVRTLSVASQFSNFVLWQADHPVDEGRDEYVRSLNEWTQLARLIHGVED